MEALAAGLEEAAAEGLEETHGEGAVAHEAVQEADPEADGVEGVEEAVQEAAREVVDLGETSSEVVELTSWKSPTQTAQMARATCRTATNL